MKVNISTNSIEKFNILQLKKIISFINTITYTEEVRQCIQKRYLYIPINQLDRGGNTIHIEEVPIYTNRN
jgi:hypothetical protein